MIIINNISIQNKSELPIDIEMIVMREKDNNFFNNLNKIIKEQEIISKIGFE